MAQTMLAPFPIAHRAAEGLDRLRAAERLGLRVVECDVHRFRGRLEVRHRKTLGPVPLLWDRWELRSGLGPRLELAQVLAAAAPDTELVLDLKGRDLRLAEEVAALLAGAGRGATIVCARAWPLLEPFRGLAAVRTVGSVGRGHQLRSVERRFAAVRPDGLSVHARLLDEATARRLLRLTPLLLSWPVASAADARRLAGLGVSGLIAADLELAAGLRRTEIQDGQDPADRALA